VQSVAARACVELASVREKIQGVIVNGITRKDAANYYQGEINTDMQSGSYGLAPAYGDLRGLEEAPLQPQRVKS